MSSEMILALVVLVVTFIIKMPIALGMVVSSLVWLFSKGMDLSIVPEIMSSRMYNNFTLLAVPLFTLSANIMSSGYITDKIYNFCMGLVGRWPGALAHVNVLGSLIFSGTSGSAIADAAGLGKMEIEHMTKEGYEPAFAAATTASSAVIGPIFPPSIPMVIYAVIAGASVGNLFLAGMVPAVLLALALCVYVAFVAHKRKYPRCQVFTRKDILKNTISALPALMTTVVLFAGIYSGVMTATEAAAVCALYALLCSTFIYRTMSIKKLWLAVKDTAKSIGQIGIMLAAAYMFSYVVSVERLPQLAGNFLLKFADTPAKFLLLTNIVLFALGMLVDSAVLQLVLLPILVPIAQQLGIDMVHFGVVFTLNTMIGLCTPPFGMLLFVVTGICKQPMKDIIKELLPQVAVMVLVLILVTYCPDVIMWLPRLVGFNT